MGSKQSGFTSVEVLVVLLIFALMSIAFMVYLPAYFEKKRDSERKVHLKQFKIQFEDYAGDNGFYPSAGEVSPCGTPALQPYFAQVPCDPWTGQAYRYVPSADRLSYQLYTILEYEQDPIVLGVGCENGCGPDGNGDGKGDYNYGITGGGALLQ